MSEAIKKPIIIFDTDMETDCDDAGALAMLCQYVRAGRAEIAAVITDVPSDYAAPACKAITDYYGVNVPIGELKIDSSSEGYYQRFGSYFEHRAQNKPYEYNESLSKMVDEYTFIDSTTTYRRVLSNADDNSITLVVIGTMTALDQLLLSEPDSISELTGIELVGKKVDRIIAMTNALYPCSNENFNWDMDSVAAERVTKICPIPIICSPSGGEIVTGFSFSTNMSKDNPVRISYEIHNGGFGKGRASWDIIALLYALEPTNPMFIRNNYGTIVYSSANRESHWIDGGLREDIYLDITGDITSIVDELERKMLIGPDKTNYYCYEYCDAPKRPLIGVTDTGESNLDKIFLAYYLSALIQAGCNTKVIRTDYDVNTIASLDGLVLTGGSDIDPSFYDEIKSECCGDTDINRDTREIDILNIFIKTGKPVLSICRGMQLLNVFFGGSLYQDISGTAPISHSSITQYADEVHGVVIEDDTKLSSIISPDRIHVNSLHHQAVRKIGDGLIVSAFSDDGIIEGIEKANHKFCIGVQWHPELRDLSVDKTKIFGFFAKSCQRGN